MTNFLLESYHYEFSAQKGIDLYIHKHMNLYISICAARLYMTEILSKRLKTLNNQSINQSVPVKCRLNSWVYE